MQAFFGRRRHALLLPLALGGCFSVSSGTCETPLISLTDSSLGNGNFNYVCPATSGEDAYCDVGVSGGVTGVAGDVPSVAAGATFSINYTDSAYQNIVPIPAVTSLTTPSTTAPPPTGDVNAPASTPVALSAPGSYAFLAEVSGSNPIVVRDFINVQVSAVASLSLSPSVTTLALDGPPISVTAVPQGSGDVTLGGAFTCTATSSEPSVVRATASGDGVVLSAEALGNAVVSLTCLGVTTKVTITVVTSTGDGGNDDAGPEGGAKDAGGDATKNESDAGDAGDAAPPPDEDAASDAAPDGEAEPDATSDSGASDADEDGGQ